jgi:hypothetical protein
MVDTFVDAGDIFLVIWEIYDGVGFGRWHLYSVIFGLREIRKTPRSLRNPILIIKENGLNVESACGLIEHNAPFYEQKVDIRMSLAVRTCISVKRDTQSLNTKLVAQHPNKSAPKRYIRGAAARHLGSHEIGKPCPDVHFWRCVYLADRGTLPEPYIGV